MEQLEREHGCCHAPRRRTKNRSKEFLIDPRTQDFSGSRLCTIALVGTDILWVCSWIFNFNWCPAWAVGPISYMLAAVTAAVAAIYWRSTGHGGGLWSGIASKISGWRGIGT